MLSPKLKADIRRLWDRFWSGGIANPLTAIEQITYLVFLKRLEDLDNARVQTDRETGRPLNSIYDVPDGETYRWSHIRQLPGEERLTHVRSKVFDWMKGLEGAHERMRDAVFVIPSANLLQGAIEIIDDLFVPSRNQDTLGDIYEMLLSEIAEAGKNGQFRTPRHIIRAMCDLVDPQLDNQICDPACGTGGFLVNAFQHILKTHTNAESLEFDADGTSINAFGDELSPEKDQALRRNHFHGFDFDRTMVRLGWMNMIQHGLENPQISYADTLGSRFNEQVAASDDFRFDVVLANPPFTGNIDKSDIGGSLQWLGTTKTELLFVDLIIDLLHVGGRAAVIVPDGVLTNSTNAHRALREKLVGENQVNAVISLPGGVFQPYTPVKTSILIFVKGGSTKQIWFYEVSTDGYTLNAKRTPQPKENDLWDLVLKYRLRFDLQRPAFVDKATWSAWQEFSHAECSAHYAQPRIKHELREIEEAVIDTREQVNIALLKDLEIIELVAPKDWTATLADLESSDYNLSAGRYRPMQVNTRTYVPPADIIRGLQTIEEHIQAGLQTLLNMVEGVEEQE
jgi:type I restriction enzyme M protein